MLTCAGTFLMGGGCERREEKEAGTTRVGEESAIGSGGHRSAVAKNGVQGRGPLPTPRFIHSHTGCPLDVVVCCT